MAEEIMWEGRFITAKRDGKWEYVSRSRGIKAAVILAVEDGHVLLVEQYRVPLGKNCIELPAGLIGDETEGEDPLEAAGRIPRRSARQYGCFLFLPRYGEREFYVGARQRPHQSERWRRCGRRGYYGPPHRTG